MAWNQPASDNSNTVRKASKSSPSFVKGAIAGCVVVALAVAACFLLFSKGPEKPKVVEKEKKIASLKEVKPAAVPKIVNEEKQSSEESERQRRREMFKAMTPQQKLDYLYEQAKKRPLPTEPSSNRLFRTGLEQVMGWVFTTELGAPPPLLPKISIFDEAHFAEILISDNPILESDSEQQKYAKECVQAAKKEFRDFIREGGNPDEFLAYYHSQLVQANNEWKDAQKSALKVIKEEPDIAAEYIKRINKQLTEKGIRKVMVNPKLLERHGIILDD